MFYESQVYKNYISRLNKKIAEWKSHNIKLAIYGAGEHTDMILKNASWSGFAADCIIDRSVLRQKDGFCGFKVIPPAEIKKTKIDAILISSFTYQEEIYSELLNMNLNDIDIIRLYTDEDILKSIKERYACKESEVRSQKSEARIKNPKSQIPNPKLEILLIHPPFALGNQRHKKILPMNMLYLSAYVMDKFPDVNVEIMDGQIKNLCLDEMYQRIMEKRWDIIGIGYWTAQSPIAFKLSEFIRNNTNALLIHGGVHPTVCPEDAVKYCDYAVMYEGEETFCEIVKLAKEDKQEQIREIKGIAYKNKGVKGSRSQGVNDSSEKPLNPRIFESSNPAFVITHPRSYIKDLDTIPFPRWELAGDLKQYNSPMHVTGGLRLPIIGSRGCPYSCTFCSSPLMWDRKVRWRKPVKIVDEMEEAIKRFNINQFHFWDDNLMMKRSHIIELCNEIMRRGLKVNWCGLTRASHVTKHKDTLPLMKEAGCVGMEIGIESFTEDSTELVRKGEGTGEMTEASMELERAGIAPLYTHMFFNPGETITGYYQKQMFLNEVNSKNTAFLADSRLGQASTPHRKTDFEREAKDLGEVFIDDLSNYIHQRINFIPHSLLNDVPVKVNGNRGSPIKFLEVALQALFDWTEDMIDTYIQTSNLLWDRIDGKKSVKELSGEIKGLLKLSDYHSKMFVSLSIVGLAREGAIISSATDLHRQKNKKIKEKSGNYS
ncbi:MAG: cobalamin B12-binding domain-containing protein [Nitrospinae bacterium]|nr:cobalamin B12-binding domain-containing protein [Nitrospinota bacterium]